MKLAAHEPPNALGCQQNDGKATISNLDNEQLKDAFRGAFVAFTLNKPRQIQQ